MRRVGMIVGGLAIVAFSFWITLYAIDSFGESSASVLQTIEVKNDVVTLLSKVLPADPRQAKPTDGVSFSGRAVSPKGKDSKLWVRVTAFASAAEPNLAVLGVFGQGQEKPLALISKPVSGNHREKVEVLLNLDAPGNTPVPLDFRIGPGKPGNIMMNGPQGGPPTQATVTIIEKKGRTGLSRWLFG